MTSENRNPRRPEDEEQVDGFLAESGFPDDAGLRELLLGLRSLRSADVPVPSADVAALLGQAPQGGAVPSNGWSRKHAKKKGIAVTTLAVAASLGVAGGAAANDEFRRQAEEAISTLVRPFAPAAPATPAPASTMPVPSTAAPATPPASGLSDSGPSPAVESRSSGTLPTEASTTVPAAPGPDAAVVPSRSAKMTTAAVPPVPAPGRVPGPGQPAGSSQAHPQPETRVPAGAGPGAPADGLAQRPEQSVPPSHPPAAGASAQDGLPAQGELPAQDGLPAQGGPPATGKPGQ